ncbi:MAG: amylo-alpha-16-glucosidase [Acidobacteria bacterium]|nr:amylo-alpha-16-glucosidase [Acidobacteriota bacterium]
MRRLGGRRSIHRLRAFAGLVLALGAWTLGPHPVAAQPSQPVVPRFAVEPSPIGLLGDVRPQQYLGVVGRRAAWLGTETGDAEIWVHPLKLAQRFRLDFRIPDYEDPVRGADVARTVEVRPELTTITYSHASFTVRQHILAPLDEPGLLVLLDVRTFTDLAVVVSFQTALQYAWPAGLGGQYASWNVARKAFLLSESLRRHNAFIGSPWATVASTHPAHAIPDAPNVFTIPVDRDRVTREFIPIIVAAGIAPREEVGATYDRLLAQAERLYAERRAHAGALRADATSINTPDTRLNRSLEWAKVNLDEQLVCNPDLGCGLVAGWGPSGRGARPGFGWFFGGDAAINSLAMSSLGLTDQVASGLRFLAKYQRDDGKIAHEVSQAAARIPWFTDYPYPYYHADTTPFWVLAVWRYWRTTGDEALLDELWPRVKRAYAWCRTVETDGDGIIENTTGGLGAIEVGEIGADIHQDIYLAAVWIEALAAMREMAMARGEAGLVSEAGATFDRARTSLNEKYWLAARAHHAFGVLRSGQTNDALTVWPATAASFSLLEADKARATLAKLAGARMTADWGTRMLASDHPLYGPTHYNMGAVWPFVTGFVALGHYAYGRPWAGFPLVDALSQMAFDWSRGRHPELLSGAYYRPLDTAVPHQFFATSMLVSPVMSGLLGWQPDAPRGAARLAPQLPPHWDRVVVDRLRVGATRLRVELAQAPGSFTARLVATGPEISLHVDPPLPPGATLVGATVDGRRVRTALDVAGQTSAGVPLADARNRLGAVPEFIRLGSRPVTVQVRWTGGLQPEPVVSQLTPGQESEGLRLTDFRWTGTTWVLDVEGVPGRSYEVRFHGAPVTSVDGGRVIERSATVTRVGLELPTGGPVGTLTITLRP